MQRQSEFLPSSPWTPSLPTRPRPGIVRRTPEQQAALIAQEALGDRLRAEAREAVRNAEGDLQATLRRNYWDLPAALRPTENEVITRIANFVRTAGQRLEARHAAMFLANAHWNLDLAFRRYTEERFSPERSPVPGQALTKVAVKAEALIEAGGPTEEEDEDEDVESEVSQEGRSWNVRLILVG